MLGNKRKREEEGVDGVGYKRPNISQEVEKITKAR